MDPPAWVGGMSNVRPVPKVELEVDRLGRVVGERPGGRVERHHGDTALELVGGIEFQSCRLQRLPAGS